jgi:hypothetical protein
VRLEDLFEGSYVVTDVLVLDVRLRSSRVCATDSEGSKIPVAVSSMFHWILSFGGWSRQNIVVFHCFFEIIHLSKAAFVKIAGAEVLLKRQNTITMGSLCSASLRSAKSLGLRMETAWLRIQLWPANCSHSRAITDSTFWMVRARLRTC